MIRISVWTRKKNLTFPVVFLTVGQFWRKKIPSTTDFVIIISLWTQINQNKVTQKLIIIFYLLYVSNTKISQNKVGQNSKSI